MSTLNLFCLPSKSLLCKRNFAENTGLFAIDLYNMLVQETPSENLTFSPLLIQACIAMAHMGADGLTAKEIERGLHLVSHESSTIAKSFKSVLAKYAKSDILKFGSKIYLMQGFTIRKQFKQVLRKKFFSNPVEINFAKNETAARNINNWIETKTKNHITQLIDPNSLSITTRMVLVNVIYFKGIWKTKFSRDYTNNENFYLNETDTVMLPIMNVESRFRYAELPELNATVLELPYRHSDLSMLIILPNSRTGLENLSKNLITISLSDITERLSEYEVYVKLPKFRAESEFNLNNSIKKLGMERMFTGMAEFSKMIKQPDELCVSKIIHKAVIEMNEESATTTEIAVEASEENRWTKKLPKFFVANKPFFYLIKDCKDNILFAGNKIKFKFQ